MEIRPMWPLCPDNIICAHKNTPRYSILLFLCFQVKIKRQTKALTISSSLNSKHKNTKKVQEDDIDFLP